MERRYNKQDDLITELTGDNITSAIGRTTG